jgi:hypothetical protein
MQAPIHSVPSRDPDVSRISFKCNSTDLAMSKKRKGNSSRIIITRPLAPTTVDSNVHIATYHRSNASGRLQNTKSSVAAVHLEHDTDTALNDPWSVDFYDDPPLSDNVKVDNQEKAPQVSTIDSTSRFLTPNILQDPTSTPIGLWKEHRQEYLDELLRHEGQSSQANCVACSARTTLFKCQDCIGSQLICARCLINSHSLLPLHRILVCVFTLTTRLLTIFAVDRNGTAHTFNQRH